MTTVSLCRLYLECVYFLSDDPYHLAHEGDRGGPTDKNRPTIAVTLRLRFAARVKYSAQCQVENHIEFQIQIFCTLCHIYTIQEDLCTYHQYNAPLPLSRALAIGGNVGGLTQKPSPRQGHFTCIYLVFVKSPIISPPWKGDRVGI